MLPTHICRVALDTVLDLLFPLLLTAAGSKDAACRAAIEMLAEYHPETAEELGLAGEIIALRLKGLTALRAATRAEAANSPVLPLLNAANTLRRNQASAQRKLDALQRARRTPAKQRTALPAASPPPTPVQQASETATPSPPSPPSPPAQAGDRSPVPAAATRVPPSIRPPAPPVLAVAAQPRPGRIDAMVQRVAEALTARGPSRHGIDVAVADLVSGYQASVMRNLIGMPVLAGAFAAA